MFYADNTEFFTPYRVGETILGGQVSTWLADRIGPRTELRIGLFADRRWGSADFTDSLKPLLAFRFHTQALARRVRHARNGRTPRAAGTTDGDDARADDADRVRRSMDRESRCLPRRELDQLAEAELTRPAGAVRARQRLSRESDPLARRRGCSISGITAAASSSTRRR